MSNISCDICMDLLPLVVDSVASEDSTNAVLAHIKTCAVCRLHYEKNEKPPMNAAKVTAKIKRQLFFLSIALMAIGVAFGIAISDGYPIALAISMKAISPRLLFPRFFGH